MMFPLIDARMFIIDARTFIIDAGIKKWCPGGGGYPISGKIQTYFHSHCKVTGNKPLISTANKLPLENIYVQLKPQKLLQVKFRCIVSESVS